MKFIDLSAVEARTARPSNEALGFNMDAEMSAACRAALKPLAKRLREYRAEEARLNALCDRWNHEAYEQKLKEIADRAQAGDEEAATAIETGAIPSRQSFNEMHARACGDVENFKLNNRHVFSEAAALVGPAMTPVVERGQAILDQTLKNFGLPEYKLHGATNHVAFTVLQLEKAGRNETSDLQWFWNSIN